MKASDLVCLDGVLLIHCSHSTPSAMAAVAQDAVVATATQPACLSVILPQHLPRTGGAGVSLVQDTEPPMTLMGRLLAVAADFDGEGSAAASNETLATVFTQVWPYIVALFDFLCSHHRISHGLLARLHNSLSSGATWPHSWLELTSPLRITCTSTVPSIMQPPQPTWLLHVTLPSHGQPALPRPHAAPLQKGSSHTASLLHLALVPRPHKSIAPACSHLPISLTWPPAPSLDPQPQVCSAFLFFLSFLISTKVYAIRCEYQLYIFF